MTGSPPEVPQRANWMSPSAPCVAEPVAGAPANDLPDQVDEDEKLHEVLVDRRARGLDHEDVGPANVVVDLVPDLPVTEAREVGAPEREPEVAGNGLDLVESCGQVPLERLALEAERTDDVMQHVLDGVHRLVAIQRLQAVFRIKPGELAGVRTVLRLA